jgi:hypothetical protein
MAKQSFSVGQVLTAAQMLSLQQTAMLGGSTTAKTTSYTLVAADAGTVVSVSSTSATTITVNTALFSAGDTVTIQNWGTGSVTITAGTATVNTAGSLIVPQYDGGVLYFTSASAAIYFDFVQAGAVSPLTTKGDLYTFASSDTRLGVGANNTVLTADSAEATGLKWVAPASGGGITQIGTTTTLSGASTTVSFSSTGYKNIYAIISNITMSNASKLGIQPNSSTTLIDYVLMGSYASGADNFGAGDTYLQTYQNLNTSDTNNNFVFTIYDAASTTFNKNFTLVAGYKDDSNRRAADYAGGQYKNTSAISAIKFVVSVGTFSAGSVRIFGES